MIILRYHLTEGEYFEYHYFTVWSAPDKRWYRIRYYLRVFSLYTAVAALYLLVKHTDQIWRDIAVFGIITLIYFLVVPLLIKRSIKKRVQGMLREPGNRHMLEDIEVTLADTGILEKDKASESRFAWDAISKKTETSSCYYLYTNSYHAIVIPKRAVPDRDNEELQRLFSSHLPLSSEFSTEQL